MSVPEKHLRAMARAVGTGPARRARRDGYVTAVIYGHGKEPLQIMIPAAEFRRVIERDGRGGIFSIDIEGEGQPRTAVLKELQVDMVNNRMIHADFQEVNLDEPVRIVVPIIFTGGETPAAKGWIVEHQVGEIEIEARPVDVPERLVVDVAHLRPGEHIEVGQLDLPAGAVLHSDPHLVVVKCAEPVRREPKEKEETPHIPLESDTAETAP